MVDALTRLHRLFDARHDLPDDLTGTIGCITAAVPIELIWAAGLRPQRLYGDPSQTPQIGDRYMETDIDGEVRSLFDQAVTGRFAGLPLILLPRVSEQHLQLYYYLGEARNWEADADIPPLRIVDVMQTDYWSTGRYVRDRMVELADILGGLGTPIGKDDLHAAIVHKNRMRTALQQLNALRRAGQFKGSDMFRMTALFGVMGCDDYLALAKDLVAMARQIPASTGPRIMLSGVMQDDPALYELIEATGAHVVADDHVTGERIFAHLIEEDVDPYDAITEHYQLHAPGLRQYPQKRQDDRFYATCQAAQVDADLCVLEDGDDTLGWDWPHRRDYLKKMGIVSHLLTGQNYFAPDRAAQTQAVQAVLNALREDAA